MQIVYEHHELAALRRVVAYTSAFAVYGFATGAPSTLGYLAAVVAVTTGMVLLRTTPLPPWLSVALPVLAAAHLAGGLVRVGNDVLYNAYFATPLLEYDHLVHTSGVFLGTVVIWQQFARPGAGNHRHAIVVCVLAGLGLGATNEMIEFLTTLAHHGAHVGGYENTGWDLVANTVGATAAGVWCSHRSR